MSTKLFDNVIEKGILFLIVFTPLAFGSVQDWSTAILELVSFTVMAAWAAKLSSGKAIALRRTPFLWLIAGFLGLVIIQLLPLPAAVLGAISPAHQSLSHDLLQNESMIFTSISIAPGMTQDELYKLLAYFGIFIVVINHYQERRQIEPVIWTAIGTGCFVTLIALAQKISWNGRLYWIYPVDPILKSNTDYIWGPFINHNHFAGYLELVMPLGFALFLYLASKARDSLSQVLLAGLGAIIMAAGIVISLSRGGILGASTSIIVLLVLARSRRSLKKATVLLMAAGVIVSCSIALAAWDRVEDRFAEIGQERKIIRPDIWRDSLKVIGDFPIIGTGLGTFGRIYPVYQTKYSTLTFEHAENDYIEILTDTGAIGLACLLALVALYLRTTYAQWKDRKNLFVISLAAGGLASCAAILVHSLTDFNSRIPANMITLAIIAGLTHALVMNVGQKGNRADSR